MSANSRIVIIGQGNVASHLVFAFKDEYNVINVNSRTLEGLPDQALCYIIAVSDNAISDVAQRLGDVRGMVVHTSGTSSLSILEKALPGHEVGVLYPMQTFTKQKALDYSQIPFFIESNTPEVLEQLRMIVSSIALNIINANSEMRLRLHLASVFACNFTNAMFEIADEILQKSGLDISVLMPLIHETVNKIEEISPKEAQTGPASRHDSMTLITHESKLASNPDWQKIYTLISDYIQKQH